MNQFSRRSLLIGSLASLAAGVPAAVNAAPRERGTAQSPSSVVVDVDRLFALGAGPSAELVRSAVTAELRSLFADGLGGRRLVVRLTALSLSSYAGGGGRSGSGDTDYLEGEALLLGPGGEILARYPQILALPASGGGAWYLPGNEQRRIVILARYYAQWLRRTMG